MLKITGYSNRVSAWAGQDIEFKVNCEYPEYQAQMVRVVQGDTAPEAPAIEILPVESAIDGRYQGRKQVIHAGSFAKVGARPPVSSEGFSLQAMIMPTTPHKGRQAIISQWDEQTGRGVALIVDGSGAVTLEICDGQGEVQRLSSGKPMLKGYWYFAAASYDAASGRAAVYQEPQVDFPTIDDGASVGADLAVGIDWANDAPLLFAATWGGSDGGRPVGKALYNGKIDRPRVGTAALSRDEMETARADRWPDALRARLAGAWDFSDDIEGVTIKDASGNGLDGEVVNMPTRGVTGHNFSGEEMCWRHRPAEWSAIHFHDDDLYDAGWETDFTLIVPEDLKSGIYAVRLEAQDEEQFITFVVRPRPGESSSKLLYLFPLATYMAYANEHFGTNDGLVELHLNRALVLHPHQIFLNEHREYGHSLYDLHSDGSGVYYSSRLRPILNMRPKIEANHGGRPSNLWLFNGDTHITGWLEHLGQDFDVVTDEDLHEAGYDLIRDYRTVVTATHPEYYSKQMCDAIADFTGNGGRLMYLGGNGFYWRVAFHKTKPGIMETRRAEGGSRAWEPPTGEYYHSFTGEYGGLWRRQGQRIPYALVGNGFAAQGFDESSYYRRTADAKDARCAFMFEGIADEILGDFGLIGGGAAGMEIDRHDTALGSPPHSLVVARSENHTEALVMVVEDMLFNFMGTTGDVCDKVRSDIVFFETTNGGAVFSTGSIAYGSALPVNDYDNNISTLTANVLRRFMDETPF